MDMILKKALDVIEAVRLLKFYQGHIGVWYIGADIKNRPAIFREIGTSLEEFDKLGSLSRQFDLSRLESLPELIPQPGEIGPPDPIELRIQMHGGSDDVDLDISQKFDSSEVKVEHVLEKEEKFDFEKRDKNQLTQNNQPGVTMSQSFLQYVDDQIMKLSNTLGSDNTVVASLVARWSGIKAGVGTQNSTSNMMTISPALATSIMDILVQSDQLNKADPTLVAFQFR